jgi:hypothetical protein
MARKSTPKVDDVFLTINKDNVDKPILDHPNIDSNTKDKMKKQNDKAAKEVADSKTSNNFINNNIPDYNSTGDDFLNDEGTYVKKLDSDTSDTTNSTYETYKNEQKEKEEETKNKFNFEIEVDENGKTKKKTINDKVKISNNIPDKTYIVSDNSTIKIINIGDKNQAIAKRPNLETVKGEKSKRKKETQLVNEMLELLSNKDGVENKYTIINSYKQNKEINPNNIDNRNIKDSPYGPFLDTNFNLNADINNVTFENLKGDKKVEIYNGQGKKLGLRPLVSKNKFDKPIIQDFYSAIARLESAASLDNIQIKLIRAFQSYENQIEIRRKYAPNNKKSNTKWLETAEPNAGFTNEYGDKIKVNKPGYGYHILGNTFDIDTRDDKTYEWLVKYAHNYGFYRTIPYEIWHWEYKPWLYRLGGIENPSNKKNNESVGGWKNESWEKLYTKLTNTKDPKGPKFLPNGHSSWLGIKGIIKNDIINDIPPFISKEDSGTTINFADLVKETPPGKSDGIPENERQLITQLKRIFNKKGYRWFNGIMQLNLIGVRNKEKKVGNLVEKYGEFDDLFYCIWKDKNNQIKVKKYNVTTEPGKETLIPNSSYYKQNGTAILKPGQYPVYKLGFHGSNKPYLAFWQVRGEVKVARDKTGSEVYDYDAPTQSGFFGINIHKSSYGVTQKISNWSEGCQVFSSFEQWKEFIEIARKSAEYQGESYSKIKKAETLPNDKILSVRENPEYQFGEFTYTLIEEEDF